MASFAEKIIAAHQAGVQERQAEQDRAMAAEDRKHQQILLKHQIDRLKISDALEARKAAIENANLMNLQPGPEVNFPAQGETPVGALPGQTQPLIPEHQGALPLPAQTIPGLPAMGGAPAIPSITVQPTSLQEHLQQQRQAAVNQRLLMPPVFGPAGTQPFLPTAGGYVSSGEPVPKEPTLPALIEEVKAVTPGFDQMTGPQKIQAIADYKKKTSTAPAQPVELQEMQDWLSKHPGAGPADFMDYKSNRAAKLAQAAQSGALKNVPPHLVAAATGDALKAGNAYADAVQANADMSDMINLAKAGNVLSYAYIPTEGVLTLNTSRGVKRVNMNEIDAYGGAGSALDRIKGYFGKQASGASIPENVLNDMATVHNSIEKNAKAAYGNKLKIANALYGSTFEPVEFGATSAKGPAVGTVVNGYVFKGGDPNDEKNWKKP